MSSEVIAALIGLGGTIIGGVLAYTLPGLSIVHRLSRKTRHHSVLGTWHSAWGPMPKGPPKNHELLTVTSQRGTKVEGFITRDVSPSKRWDFEGRYDGLFLQLYYFPSSASKDTDFLEYGCYFFSRKADGSFVGYSTGFGQYEGDTREGVSTDFHVLRRRDT